MMAYEDLMDGLIQFGRRNVHDLLIRSHDIDDVTTYLWVELYYEMSRASTFETLDLVNFEKRVGLGYPFYPMADQAQGPIPRRLPKLNDGLLGERLKKDC